MMTHARDVADYLVLGAGLAGLSAAHALGERALVLEQDARPGGLVRSECLAGGYWFDHAVHLLYFANPAIKEFVQNLSGVHLASCPPRAHIETSAGVAPYPIQSHLAWLEPATVAACVADFREQLEQHHAGPLADYEAFLLNSFGRSLCELFFFPYNRKLWKRPLTTLAPTGFQWNIQRPKLENVLAGASAAREARSAYNSEGYYPCPPAGARLRGIEVLSRALARLAPRIELGARVVEVDPDNQTVTVEQGGAQRRFTYRERLCATLPLPLMIRLCRHAPSELVRGCLDLRHNRVRSLCVALQGPRPQPMEHWRYYTDESLSFHRLVYPHAFDPLNAPEDGFGILAELTELGEAPKQPDGELIARVLDDLERVGVVPRGARILATSVIDLETAYVVFGVGQQDLVERAKSYLAERHIHVVGRYARWEYSSMAQVLEDGLRLGASLLDGRASS